MPSEPSPSDATAPTAPRLRIVMLGWEYPPYVTGGLGAASAGLARSLAAQGHDVRFMLPVADDQQIAQPGDQRDAVQAVPIGRRPATTAAEQASETTTEPAATDLHSHAHVQPVPSRFVSPYTRPAAGYDDASHPPTEAQAQQPSPGDDHRLRIIDSLPGQRYQGDLFADAQRYAERCVELLQNEKEPFDVVHAHDWLAFPAGVALARALGLPVVLHVHSMEHDRSPGHEHGQIEAIERDALHQADRVIAVSSRTRDALIRRYGLYEEKVTVVYNGLEPADMDPSPDVKARVHQRVRTVLFLGRITEQKGARYLLQAAQRVLERDNRVRFIFAGSGDGLEDLIDRSARMKLGSRVMFTGFLQPDEVARALQAADLMVVPSVSEPFGLVALEAVRSGVPLILSTTTGAAEVLHHSLKVDYWDVPAMASKILAVLHHPALAGELRSRAKGELARRSWTHAAEQCVRAYLSAGATQTPA